MPQYDAYHRSSDHFDNISPYQRPRGQGGVAVLFKHHLKPFVQECDEGTERILPIEIAFNSFKLCLVSVYLPTQGDAAARSLLLEALDVIHNIMSKYRETHTILIAGDFNASLVRNKPQDIILRDFMNTHGLTNIGNFGTKPTFISHTGLASSQIDYFLTTQPEVFLPASIIEDNGLNTSSHVPIQCETRIEYAVAHPKPVKSTNAIKRLLWKDGDLHAYNSMVAHLLADIPTAQSDATTCLMGIVESLHQAAAMTIPSKIIRLKGPKWKLSPEAFSICQEAKELHKISMNPPPGTDLDGLKARQEAKHLLRSQLRSERAEDRIKHIQDIMTCDPGDPALFAKLISKQRAAPAQTQALMIDGCLQHDPKEQCEGWANYIEKLATPLQAAHFDDEHHSRVSKDVDWIKILCRNGGFPSKPITRLEVKKAVLPLKLGKAAGIDNIAPEHIKHAADALTPTLTDLFNLIRSTKKIPDALKLGILTPIGKKGKNLLFCDNHRGITVTEIIGKVLENIYREREKASSHPLQFGFSKGLSPTMAALVLTEAITEAKSTKRDLYVAALDSQKAFDVVSHPSLLRKLFLADDIDPETWLLLEDMQNGMSTAVRWKGFVSRAVEIRQGVRQGGVLSPGHYKRYVDNLLHSLQNSALGITFGELYAGCPTVADDVLLMATSEWDLQAMLDISDHYAASERYNIQPAKSSVTSYSRPGSASLCPNLKKWTLGENPLPITQSFTHLGITRFSMEVKDTAIVDKVQTARRAGYALMGSGLHGTNGLPAHVGLKIYKSYVLPRLLYGIEAMNLDAGQMNELERFHLRFLRQLQSLPDRTAKCGVYILLGSIPMEAYYHLAVLSLLERILR